MEKVEEEYDESEKCVLWNADRIVRAVHFITKTKINDEKDRIFFIRKSIGVGLFAQIALTDIIAKEASILCFVPKYVLNWETKVQERFGNDTLKLIKEVWIVCDALENEKYDKVKNSSFDSRCITLAVTIEWFTRTSVSDKLTQEDKAYNAQIADWRMSYLNCNAELTYALQKQIRKFLRNERITIEGISSKPGKS